jgi:leader peptidase (prepilin peptidase)/N-methyltransferase
MSFLYVFLFFLGAVWGSFLNVVIYRSSKNMSFVSGRSICPKCKKTLRWYHNIPLLSFVLLRGRCAYCHKKISVIYPAMEIVTGLFRLVVGLDFLIA